MRSSETKTKAGRVDRLARQAADYVQGSRGPIPSHDELDAERIQRAKAEKQRLYDWAEENDLIFESALKTDKGGFEHVVSFKPEKLLVIKETRADKGFGGGLALNNKNAATVGEYLDRINIANEEFGSEIKLLGVRRTVQGPSIRTQMPFFKGGPAMADTAGNHPGIRPVRPRPLCTGQTSLGNSNQSLHHRRRWPVEKMAGSGLVQSTLRPEDGRLARPLCRTQQLSRARFRPDGHTVVPKSCLASCHVIVLHQRSPFFLSRRR